MLVGDGFQLLCHCISRNLASRLINLAFKPSLSLSLSFCPSFCLFCFLYVQLKRRTSNTHAENCICRGRGGDSQNYSSFFSGFYSKGYSFVRSVWGVLCSWYPHFRNVRFTLLASNCTSKIKRFSRDFLNINLDEWLAKKGVPLM